MRSVRRKLLTRVRPARRRLTFDGFFWGIWRPCGDCGGLHRAPAALKGGHKLAAKCASNFRNFVVARIAIALAARYRLRHVKKAF